MYLEIKYGPERSDELEKSLAELLDYLSFDLQEVKEDAGQLLRFESNQWEGQRGGTKWKNQN